MSGIQIPTEAFQEVVQAAILQSITAEHRDMIMTAAVNFLITAPQPTNSWGAKPRSPLQEAFDSAISTTAHKVVREMFETDETLQARVRNAAAEAIAGMDDSQFTDALARAFAEAMRKQRD